MINDLEISELLDAGGEEFERAYALYCAAFPESERETQENLIRWIEAKGSKRIHPDDVHFLVSTSAEHGIVAIAVVHYIDAIQSGFLGYLVVDPRFRSRSIGSQLFAAAQQTVAHDAHERGYIARGIFMELDREDPHDPDVPRRFDFWKKHGVLPLYIDWRYPPLHGGEPPASMYLAYGPFNSGDALTSDEITAAARAVYHSVYKKDDNDPDLQAVLASIKTLAVRGEG